MTYVFEIIYPLHIFKLGYLSFPFFAEFNISLYILNTSFFMFLSNIKFSPFELSSFEAQKFLILMKSSLLFLWLLVLWSHS